MKPAFLSDYTRIVTKAIPAEFPDNYDAYRFGPESAKEKLRSLRYAIRRKLAEMGLVTASAARKVMLSGKLFVAPHLPDLEWLYEHLEDQESRDLLVSLIAFRALGRRKVKLACNNPAYWANIHRVEKCASSTESIDASFSGWRLPKIDLRQLQVPVTLFMTAKGASTTFFEQQYRCVTADGPIEVSEKDVAIDAGACWGDTALYFATKAGPLGRVFSFEFLPANLEIFHRNLDLNPHLKDRIEVVKNPVWSSSGQTLFVNANGPATQVGTAALATDSLTVNTLSIDDFVSRNSLNRLDFLKMDIEGAEMAALKGAESALRRFKPKLAITVYHSLADFWLVPQYLESLGLNYRFYLRHFTIHSEETVLFAKAA